LRFATLDGAAACGLDHKIGSIAPGKEADLVLIRADDVNTMPINDPAAVVVTSADTSNVDSVFVRGRTMKRHGQLVDIDLHRLHDLASASRDHVCGTGS
jgi:cytosine/adenosine deaminase-related metal-dependent hydrolase